LSIPLLAWMADMDGLDGGTSILLLFPSFSSDKDASSIFLFRTWVLKKIPLVIRTNKKQGVSLSFIFIF